MTKKQEVTHADINFSSGEVNDIILLINIAIKVEGLNVAEAGLFYQKKFLSAFKPKNKK